MSIAQDMIRQLEATWQMAAELIDACPPEQWTAGAEAYFRPAGQMYHLLDCAQCLCGNPPRPAPTPKPFGPGVPGTPYMVSPERQT